MSYLLKEDGDKILLETGDGILLDALVVAPTVTTQAASAIASTTCTGNGNITATGGANATRRGFCYMAGTSGDPTVESNVVCDSYSESNENDAYGLSSTLITKLGQSFTGNGSNLKSCKFNLGIWGNPTGNIIAKIYAHTGTFGSSGTPTGVALATSNNIDVSTLSSNYDLVEFTFTGINKITLTNGTYYFIVLEYSGGDDNNNVGVSIDSSSPTHTGNSAGYSGSWTAYPADICFYVYTDGVAYDDGSFGTGAYTKGIIGLSAGTGYRVRAYAVNSEGTSYGATVQVTTTSTYTLVCSAGSFTLTGQAVGLKADRKITCETGNYTYTGVSVGLKIARKLTCETGNYAYTGIDVILRKGYKIVCSCGSFTYTGIDVGLRKGYRLICGTGKYILTGIDILFKRSMRNRAKSSTSFTNRSKNSTTLTNKAKNSTIFTNRKK